ncbi:MAG TPA: PAS domain-containing protein, partial [Opitutaceae bacterium]
MHLSVAIETLERKLDRLLESLVVGCWIRGARGEPGFWSEQVFKFYGLTPSEQAPPIETILQQLDSSAQAGMWQSVERCTGGEEPFGLEYTVRTPTGANRMLKSRGYLTTSDRSEPMIIGTIQDVSAIQPLRNEIKFLTNALRKTEISDGRPGGLTPRQWARIEETIE